MTNILNKSALIIFARLVEILVDVVFIVYCYVTHVTPKPHCFKQQCLLPHNFCGWGICAQLNWVLWVSFMTAVKTLAGGIVKSWLGKDLLPSSLMWMLKRFSSLYGTSTGTSVPCWLWLEVILSPLPHGSVSSWEQLATLAAGFITPNKQEATERVCKGDGSQNLF